MNAKIRVGMYLMKYVSLIILHAVPFFCSASFTVNAEYSVSSMYTGTIADNRVTMNLITYGNTVVGSYVYDKYRKKILLSGVDRSGFVELAEKTENGSAMITLYPIEKGYTGYWCEKNACLYLFMLIMFSGTVN